MVFFLLLLLFSIAVIGIGVAVGQSPDRRGPNSVAPPEPSEEPTPSEFALQDPVEALRRYGTPADAARLAEQGVDLTALGYRPPTE